MDRNYDQWFLEVGDPWERLGNARGIWIPVMPQKLKQAQEQYFNRRANRDRKHEITFPLMGHDLWCPSYLNCYAAVSNRRASAS
jgi:hypothetical protein